MDVQSRAAQRTHVPAAYKELSAAVLGSLLGVAGGLAVSEADVQAAYMPQPAAVEVQMAQPPQLQQQAPQAVRPTQAFDAVMLSIIHVTDDLSLAAGSLLDLTATASTGYTGASSSDTSSGTLVSGALQLAPVLQPAAPQDAMAAQQQQQQVQQAEEVSTARLMSQQALAMATQALKLATLLEGQQGDGSCDPAEQELLQQIAAAARQVSVMAADIVQPVVDSDAAGLGDADEAAVSGGSDAANSDAPAAGGGRASSANSSSSAAGLHNFAGLPVLGMQAQQVGQPSCQVAPELAAADALQHCLQL